MYFWAWPYTRSPPNKKKLAHTKLAWLCLTITCCEKCFRLLHAIYDYHVLAWVCANNFLRRYMPLWVSVITQTFRVSPNLISVQKLKKYQSFELLKRILFRRCISWVITKALMLIRKIENPCERLKNIERWLSLI